MFLPRPTLRYKSRRPSDALLQKCLQEIANKHKRFGYRRAHALLRREGHKVNHKRVYRLWRAEGLAVRKRTKKKPCLLPKQERPCAATYPHQVWCVDFVADQTMSGAKLRILSVTDEWTRRSLALEVGRSLTAAKVVAVLQAAIASAGTAPAFLRMDNGPEFIALALRGFCHRSGMETAYIDRGSPWQNGFAESFHGKFRDEFLSQEVFLSVKDAQVRSELWRKWYNKGRLHSRLGYQTPNEFAAQCQNKKQGGAETNTPSGT